LTLRGFTAGGAALCVAALAIDTGCDSQVPPTYEGQPIAVLHGTVATTPESAPQPGAKAAILWLTPTGEAAQADPLFPEVKQYKYRLVAFGAPVSGGFPATFELRILTPPPAEALLGFGPPVTSRCQESPAKTCVSYAFTPVDNTQPREVAIGYIVALAPDANLDSIAPGDIVGAALDAFLTYNAHDLAAGGNAASYVADFHGETTAGYHLVTAKPPADKAKPSYWKSFLEAIELQYQECTPAQHKAGTCITELELSNVRLARLPREITRGDKARAF
jgi:hypothetical protein